MTSLKERRIEEAFMVFKKERVAKLDHLMELLDSSRSTVQHRFKRWAAYTSYNQNGRYYAHPDIPKFNKYGIWKYKDILFSKHGNLKKTFVYTVDNSVAGLNANNISEILELPAHTFLGHYKDDPNIYREKYKGLYIYFSKKGEILKKQKYERDKIANLSCNIGLPSDADAVNILVEFIKHLGETTEQLAHRLHLKGHELSIATIRNLLVYHGLEKKNWVWTCPIVKFSS